jgi:transposase
MVRIASPGRENMNSFLAGLSVAMLPTVIAMSFLNLLQERLRRSVSAGHCELFFAWEPPALPACRPSQASKMRQKSVPAATQVVKTIRRDTRRHFSVEDKIRIVLEGLRGEDSIAELSRREGIVQNLYYRWSKDLLEADVDVLLLRNPRVVHEIFFRTAVDGISV